MPRKSSGSTWTITPEALIAWAIAAAAAPAAPALMKHLRSRPPNSAPDRRSSLCPFQDQQDRVRTLLAGELGRPLLARLGPAELQRVSVELVDAREGLALELALGDGEVDL